jgi:hypothetical protein
MNSYLKAGAVSALAGVLPFAGFEAGASAIVNDRAAAVRTKPAVALPQDELDDPPCNSAPFVKLTGARGRPRAGSREAKPRSAPAMTEPPVFVKNPFLPMAP